MKREEIDEHEFFLFDGINVTYDIITDSVISKESELQSACQKYIEHIDSYKYSLKIVESNLFDAKALLFCYRYIQFFFDHLYILLSKSCLHSDGIITMDTSAASLDDYYDIAKMKAKKLINISAEDATAIKSNYAILETYHVFDFTKDTVFSSNFLSDFWKSYLKRISDTSRDVDDDDDN